MLQMNRFMVQGSRVQGSVQGSRFKVLWFHPSWNPEQNPEQNPEP
jgi:hypothetical protein